jgi:hypothetical protein
MAQQRQHSDLASAMFPHLSREAKAREVMTAQQRAEQKARNERLVTSLHKLSLELAQMRKEGRL